MTRSGTSLRVAVASLSIWRAMPVRSWRRAANFLLPLGQGAGVDSVQAGVFEGGARFTDLGVVVFDGVGAGKREAVSAGVGFVCFH